MSERLRIALADEIVANSTKRIGTYDIGSLFSTGQTSLSRVNLQNVVTNYYNVRANAIPLTQETAHMSAEALRWHMFTTHLMKAVSTKNKGSRLWNTVGKPVRTNDVLTFYYKRPAISGKNVGDFANSLEETFNEMLKKEVKTVLRTKKFIDYSHGRTLPKDFEKDTSGQSSMKMGPNVSKDGVQGVNQSFNSPGALGTKAQKDIENAIYSVLKNGAEEIAGNKRLYTSISKVVKAKYEDIFQVHLNLNSKTTKKSDGSTATFEGQLVFSDDKLNPGGPDQKLRNEMEKWLRQKWNDEIGLYLKKLMKVDIIRAQAIWGDSPGPVDRLMILQQGLIAEGLVTAMGKLDKRSKRVSKDGGLDMRLKVNKEFIKKMNKITRKGINAKNSIKKAKGMKSSTKRSGGGAVALAKPKQRTVAMAKTAKSPLHLEAMLQALLPQVVASKMGQGGALNYQTGRFANSVKPEAVMVGPQGGVQVNYTYDKFPYQTFEPGFKQGSTQRDPRKIIGESVREIAQSIIGSKFLKVRRV